MQAMQAWLELADGRRFPLPGEHASLGRHAENDVSLADRTLSRFHARFDLVDGGWRLTDTGSSSGCFVDGRRLHADNAGLADGARLRIGAVDLTFRHDDSLGVLGRSGPWLLCAAYDRDWCRAVHVDDARVCSAFLGPAARRPAGAAGAAAAGVFCADHGAGVFFSAVQRRWQERQEQPEPSLVAAAAVAPFDALLTFDGRLVRVGGADLQSGDGPSAAFVRALLLELFPARVAVDDAVRERVGVEDLRALHAAAPVWS